MTMITKPKHLVFLATLFAAFVGLCAPQQSMETSDAQNLPTIIRDASVNPLDASSVNDVTLATDRASSCPEGMQHVVGRYCPRVEQVCARWSTNDPRTAPPMRCLEYSSSRCLTTIDNRPMLDFCMDTYEYPNRAGQNPITMVSWYQAQQSCSEQGKRLCTDIEHTFACEGPNVLPYPYGFVRDSTVCRIDHQTVHYSPSRLSNPATRLEEARRSYEAVPSGSMNRCVSWSGVHDITGNVDEWIVNTHSQSLERAPYRSGLRSGWWGPVRTRCRAMTVIHGPTFQYYQIGFRCCLSV